jgi:DNA-binding MarR family transcriptional regulator
MRPIRESPLPSPSESPGHYSVSSEEATEQLAEDLRRVVGNLVREVRSGSHTLSSAQSETLGLLDRHGPASISAIAAHRHVKHQSMRLVIAQLEQQQLVTRSLDPSDARKQLFELTHQGRVALEHSRHQRSDWLARQLKEKTTASELQTLEAAVRILEQLTASASSGQSV